MLSYRGPQPDTEHHPVIALELTAELIGGLIFAEQIGIPIK